MMARRTTTARPARQTRPSDRRDLLDVFLRLTDQRDRLQQQIELLDIEIDQAMHAVIDAASIHK